jgi:hypothetical protein
MTEYSSVVALAKKLITKKGRSGVSLYRGTPNTPANPARPWKLDVTVADQLIASGLHALFLDQREVRGDRGDAGLEIALRSVVYMPDSLLPGATTIGYFIPSELSGQALKTGDLVVTGTNRYSVIECKPLKPGDELVLYVVQLKE